MNMLRISLGLFFLCALTACDLESGDTGDTGDGSSESGEDEETPATASTKDSIQSSDETPDVDESESKTVDSSQESSDAETPDDPGDDWDSGWTRTSTGTSTGTSTTSGGTTTTTTGGGTTTTTTDDPTLDPRACYADCIRDPSLDHAHRSEFCLDMDVHDCNRDICTHESYGHFQFARLLCMDECEYDEIMSPREIEKEQCTAQCRLDFVECGGATTCDNGAMSTCYALFGSCNPRC